MCYKKFINDLSLLLRVVKKGDVMQLFKIDPSCPTQIGVANEEWTSVLLWEANSGIRVDTIGSGKEITPVVYNGRLYLVREDKQDERGRCLVEVVLNMNIMVEGSKVRECFAGNDLLQVIAFRNVDRKEEGKETRRVTSVMMLAYPGAIIQIGGHCYKFNDGHFEIKTEEEVKNERVLKEKERILKEIQEGKNCEWL